MLIKQVSVSDASMLAQYYTINASHLNRWESVKDRGYHKLDAWTQRLEQCELEQKDNKAAYFVALNTSATKVIATCNLTNIVHGAFLACYMGYSVSKEYEGCGKMKQLCQHVISYAFNNLALNRIMANYMPNNERSENLLKSLGFEIEGRAKKYLFINGLWQDHILTSLISHN